MSKERVKPDMLPDEVHANKAVIRRALLQWFRSNARSLPWRGSRDPYTVWLSEIILQQTRVEQGLPYFERFITAYPTVHELANAREDEVLKLWEGLGYYSRARNLLKAARVVASEWGGQFPREPEALERLPGAGRYTAGAIASIAFDVRAPLVDGNVSRVLARLFNLTACIDSAATKDLLWRMAGELVPRKCPGDFNQALMELGARICTPKAPLCDACPIRKYCEAHRTGTQAERPVRPAKKAVPHRRYAVAIIEKRGKYLIAKRPSNGLLGGLWEFPGAENPAGHIHRDALARAMKDVLDIEVTPGERIGAVNHVYSHLRVTLHVFRCEYRSGAPIPRWHAEVQWAGKSQLGGYAFSKANQKIIELI